MNDFTGLKIGRLLILSQAATDKKQRRFVALCDCGTTKIVTAFYLKRSGLSILLTSIALATPLQWCKAILAATDNPTFRKARG